MRIQDILDPAIQAISSQRYDAAGAGAQQSEAVERPTSAQELINTVLRNIVDLSSNFSKGGLDDLLGGGRPGFGFGYTPRRGPNGAHLANYKTGYARSRTAGSPAVSHRAAAANWGAFGLRSTVQNYLYHGSHFRHPLTGADPRTQQRVTGMLQQLDSMFQPRFDFAMRAISALRV